MLLRQLDRGSATRRTLIGEANDWGVTEHLIADLIDAVQVWSWAQIGSKKIPRPDPIRRPVSRERDARGELLDRLLEQRERLRR